MNGGTKPLHRDQFIIAEDVDSPVDGWTDGSSWNGWEMPYFDRAGAEQVVEAFNRRIELFQQEPASTTPQMPRPGAWYDAAADAFCFRQASGEDPECYAATTVSIDDVPVQLYAIGRGEW